MIKKVIATVKLSLGGDKLSALDKELASILRETLKTAIEQVNTCGTFEYPHQLIRDIKSKTSDIKTGIWEEKGKGDKSARELQKELEFQLLEDNEKLVVFESGKYFKAKRKHLCKCDFFERMLNSEMKESKGVIELMGIDKKTFEQVYCYLENNAVSKDKNVIELYKAADRFGIIDLKKRVYKYMEKKISIEDNEARTALGLDPNWDILESELKCIKNPGLPDKLFELFIKNISVVLESLPSISAQSGEG